MGPIHSGRSPNPLWALSQSTLSAQSGLGERPEWIGRAPRVDWESAQSGLGERPEWIGNFVEIAKFDRRSLVRFALSSKIAFCGATSVFKIQVPNTQGKALGPFLRVWGP